MDAEYVVVDVETTGYYPGGHDRIVEIGVVGLDPEGSVVDEYETLINPSRDLGPTWLHGIEARDVLDAPEFSEVCGHVARCVVDSTVVGHNVSFDLRFLESEFTRAGFTMPGCHSIDTVAVARLTDDRIPRTRLEDVCAHFGISFDGTAHSALADARATAALFASCLASLAPADLKRIIRSHRGLRASAGDWPSSLPSVSPVPRSKAAARRSRERSFVVSVIADLPADPAASGDSRPYRDALQKALQDRRISPEEIERLRLIASQHDLTTHDVLTAHREYLTGLVSVALKDGIISALERRDLEEVAGVLGLSDSLDSLLEQVEPEDHGSAMGTGGPGRLPVAGRSICFTGALRAVVHGSRASRAIATEIATSRGMTVKRTVTQDLDYLVAADPDSMSGKAGKARRYGVSIIAESVFWNMMGVDTGT